MGVGVGTATLIDSIKLSHAWIVNCPNNRLRRKKKHQILEGKDTHTQLKISHKRAQVEVGVISLFKDIYFPTQQFNMQVHD